MKLLNMKNIKFTKIAVVSLLVGTSISGALLYNPVEETNTQHDEISNQLDANIHTLSAPLVEPLVEPVMESLGDEVNNEQDDMIIPTVPKIKYATLGC